MLSAQKQIQGRQDHWDSAIQPWQYKNNKLKGKFDILNLQCSLDLMPVMWILLLTVIIKGYSSHLDLNWNTVGKTDFFLVDF